MQEGGLRTRLTWLAAVAAFALVALWVQQVVGPQRGGILALAAITAPHQLLATQALWLLALRAPPGGDGRAVRILRLSLAGVLIFGVVRFGPGVISVPPTSTAGAGTVRVLSWNLEATGSGVDGLADVLRGSGAEVIGLQELDRGSAAMLEADADLMTRYPYHVFRPRDGSTGIGMLSAHPITDAGWLDVDPSTIWARVDLGSGREIVAVTSHPLPGVISLIGGYLPVDFDPSQRDAAIAILRRDYVDTLLSRDDDVLLFGDFNVTDREPGYSELSTGLRDAHSEVGLGPGSTWRPARLEGLPFGVLRIDYVFTGGAAYPLSITSDCAPRGSDHCIVRAVIEVRG